MKRRPSKYPALARKVLKLVDGFLASDRDPPARSEAQKAYILILLYFLTKARQNLAAIVRLCRMGYSIQAMMVARSTFEMCITIEYIMNDIPKRAMLFAEYDWVVRNSWLVKSMKHKDAWPELLSGGKPKVLNEIIDNYEKVKDKFPDEYQWAGKRMSLAKMCASINAGMSYDFQYGMLCQIMHNSISLFDDYIPEDDKKEPRSGVNNKYRVTALATAIINTIQIASHYCDLYELKRDDELEVLLDEFRGKKDRRR